MALPLLAALIVSGVTILPISAPTPRCDRAPRSLLSVTVGTEAEALERLAAKVVEAGGDTLKITRSQEAKGRGLVRIEGYGFFCGNDAAQRR